MAETTPHQPNEEPSDHDTTSTTASEAAKTGNIPLLREALRHGAQPKDLAINALSNGSPDVYACLLDAGLDVNYRLPGYAGSALVCASQSANVPLVRFLLSRGADPNLDAGWGGQRLQSLAIAASSWKPEAATVIKLLLDAGAEAKGSGAVQVAAMKGRLENVGVLVEGGADVNEVNGRIGKERAVRLARENGHEEVAEFLGKHGGEE